MSGKAGKKRSAKSGVSGINPEATTTMATRRLMQEVRVDRAGFRSLDFLWTGAVPRRGT